MCQQSSVTCFSTTSEHRKVASMLESNESILEKGVNLRDNVYWSMRTPMRLAIRSFLGYFCLLFNNHPYQRAQRQRFPLFSLVLVFHFMSCLTMYSTHSVESSSTCSFLHDPVFFFSSLSRTSYCGLNDQDPAEDRFVLSFSNTTSFLSRRKELSTHFLVLVDNGVVHAVTSSGELRWSKSIKAYPVIHSNQSDFIQVSSSSLPENHQESARLSTNSEQRMLSSTLRSSQSGFSGLPPSTEGLNESRRFVPGLDGQIFYKSEDGVLTGESSYSHRKSKEGSKNKGRNVNSELRIGQTRWVVRAMDIVKHVERWRLEWRELTPMVNFGDGGKGVQTDPPYDVVVNDTCHSTTYNLTQKDMTNCLEKASVNFFVNSPHKPLDFSVSLSLNNTTRGEVPLEYNDVDRSHAVVDVDTDKGNGISLYLRDKDLIFSQWVSHTKSWPNQIGRKTVRFRFSSGIAAVYAVEPQLHLPHMLVLRSLVDVRTSRWEPKNIIPLSHRLGSNVGYQSAVLALPFRLPQSLTTLEDSTVQKQSVLFDEWRNVCSFIADINHSDGAVLRRTSLFKVSTNVPRNASHVLRPLIDHGFLGNSLWEAHLELSSIISGITKSFLRGIWHMWIVIRFVMISLPLRVMESNVNQLNFITPVVLLVGGCSMGLIFALYLITKYKREWIRRTRSRINIATRLHLISYEERRTRQRIFQPLLKEEYFGGGYSYSQQSDSNGNRREELDTSMEHDTLRYYTRGCRKRQFSTLSTMSLRASLRRFADDNFKYTLAPQTERASPPRKKASKVVARKRCVNISAPQPVHPLSLLSEPRQRMTKKQTLTRWRWRRKSRSGSFADFSVLNKSSTDYIEAMRSSCYISLSTRRAFALLSNNTSSVGAYSSHHLSFSHIDAHHPNESSSSSSLGINVATSFDVAHYWNSWGAMPRQLPSTEEGNSLPTLTSKNWLSEKDEILLQHEEESTYQENLLDAPFSYANQGSSQKDKTPHIGPIGSTQGTEWIMDCEGMNNVYMMQKFKVKLASTLPSTGDLSLNMTALKKQQLTERRKRPRVDSNVDSQTVSYYEGTPNEDEKHFSLVNKHAPQGDSTPRNEAEFCVHINTSNDNSLRHEELVSGDMGSVTSTHHQTSSILDETVKSREGFDHKAGGIPLEAVSSDVRAQYNATSIESHLGSPPVLVLPTVTVRRVSRGITPSISHHPTTHMRSNIDASSQIGSRYQDRLITDESVTLPPPLFPIENVNEVRPCRVSDLVPRLQYTIKERLTPRPHDSTARFMDRVSPHPSSVAADVQGVSAEPSFNRQQNLQSCIPPESVLAGFVDNGRFCRTFTDIHIIGRGGFGSVYRVRHRFEPDSPEYAVKFVTLRLKASENISSRRYFREVSANRDLFSRQVVRYFTWWCEEPQFLPQNASDRLDYINGDADVPRVCRKPAGIRAHGGVAHMSLDGTGASKPLGAFPKKKRRSRKTRGRNNSSSCRPAAYVLEEHRSSSSRIKRHVKRNPRERLKRSRPEGHLKRNKNRKLKVKGDLRSNAETLRTVSCDTQWNNETDIAKGWLPFTDSSTSSGRTSYGASHVFVGDRYHRDVLRTDNGRFYKKKSRCVPALATKSIQFQSNMRNGACQSMVATEPGATSVPLVSTRCSPSYFRRSHTKLLERKGSPLPSCNRRLRDSPGPLRRTALASLHYRQLAWLVSRPGALASTLNLRCTSDPQYSNVRKSQRDQMSSNIKDSQLGGTETVQGDFIVFEKPSNGGRSEVETLNYSASDNNPAKQGESRRKPVLRWKKNFAYYSPRYRLHVRPRYCERRRRNADKGIERDAREKRFAVTLLIQMELVSGTTLREWLDRKERESNVQDIIARFRGTMGAPKFLSACTVDPNVMDNEFLKDSNDHKPLIRRSSRPIELILFRQLVKGLRDIHTHGIVHRDIKPENIFVDDVNLTLKIGDFGLARFIEAKTILPKNSIEDRRNHNYSMGCGDHYSLLQRFLRANAANFKGSMGSANMQRVDSLVSVKGLVIGTPGYTAPEGGALCTEKADIFSASLILLELLCPRFSTAMERHKTLENFRTRQKIPEHITMYLPPWADLMKGMGALDPRERPSAETVYQCIKAGLNPLLNKTNGQGNGPNAFRLALTPAPDSPNISPLSVCDGKQDDSVQNNEMEKHGNLS